MRKRILIASPVQRKETILIEFLESLERLDTTEIELSFAFIDDNNEHDLLYRFAQRNSNTLILPCNSNDSYICNEQTHYWGEGLFWKLAAFKDKVIQLATEEDYDYLFLADSDLYLQPPTITHLISLDKDIVSEVFWTKWYPGSNPLPQVWVSDQYRLYEAQRGENLTPEEINRRTSDFLRMLEKPGTYKVGGLGACTLISRKALTLGVSFREIYNLGLWGEDRHFCIRAAALGLELWADTHYPPFHIYRDSELERLPEYKKYIGYRPISSSTEPVHSSSDLKHPQEALCHPPAPSKKTGSHITLALLVRNEADRYLDKVLNQARQYIDEAVILDDASEDNTVEVCKSLLQGIPLTLVSNSEPGFHNEVTLRKQLWDLTVSTHPDWILILDADEIFEDKAVKLLRELALRQDIFHYYFRLYDLWDENAYREDTYWSAHKWYRPFMIRYIPDFEYRWRETPQHCGRFPENIHQHYGEIHPLRIKHLGWMKPEDRLKKYRRYQELDPDAVYGIKEQYESILDPNPNLIPWSEE